MTVESAEEREVHSPMAPPTSCPSEDAAAAAKPWRARKALALGEVVQEETEVVEASTGGIPTPKYWDSDPKASGFALLELRVGVSELAGVASSRLSVSTQGVESVGVKGVSREVPVVGFTEKDPPEGGEWGSSKGA